MIEEEKYLVGVYYLKIEENECFDKLHKRPKVIAAKKEKIGEVKGL